MSETPINGFDGEYSFLSNFYKVPIAYEGQSYPSVEHAYQAAKSLCQPVRAAFSSFANPVLSSAQAKRAGKKVVLRDDWNEVKLDVMLELLRHKFFSFTTTEQLLLATGERELIEDNWWGDTFWGKCKGIGENHLGRLLMQVRKELRDNQGK